MRASMSAIRSRQTEMNADPLFAEIKIEAKNETVQASSNRFHTFALSLVHERGERFKRHCHVAMRRGASALRLTDFQAAATASRHVVIAAARSTRCDLADVRWRWTLNVL